MRYIVINTKTEYCFVDADSKPGAVNQAETFQEYFGGIAKIEAINLEEGK